MLQAAGEGAASGTECGAARLHSRFARSTLWMKMRFWPRSASSASKGGAEPAWAGWRCAPGAQRPVRVLPRFLCRNGASRYPSGRTCAWTQQPSTARPATHRLGWAPDHPACPQYLPRSRPSAAPSPPTHPPAAAARRGGWGEQRTDDGAGWGADTQGGDGKVCVGASMWQRQGQRD